MTVAATNSCRIEAAKAVDWAASGQQQTMDCLVAFGKTAVQDRSVAGGFVDRTIYHRYSSAHFVIDLA